MTAQLVATTEDVTGAAAVNAWERQPLEAAEDKMMLFVRRRTAGDLDRREVLETHNVEVEIVRPTFDDKVGSN